MACYKLAENKRNEIQSFPAAIVPVKESKNQSGER